MLGCQDFCGYYDWTFHYIRRRWGKEALQTFMSEAIGEESQSHYSKAAADGLRGLLQCWDKTGGDEHCDWTFTLDEQRNVLRWDMRQCPSKGFLLDNDLNADEDYCDHCMGWIVPLLDRAGIEMVAHEHNHCGQCWAEMRVRGKPYESLAGRAGDIQLDPRWQRGFVDRWRAGTKQPLQRHLPDLGASTDPCDVLIAWLGRSGGARPEGGDTDPPASATNALAENAIVTGAVYASADAQHGEPRAVVLDDRPDDAQLDAIAGRFNATPLAQRPLLTCAYLPGRGVPPNFVAHGIPRPIPILPLLIRTGHYQHKPGSPHPTTAEFAVLLARAVGKRADH
jgi:hypothetical protein